MTKDKKPAYEKPVIMPLGELARGMGVCNPGSNVGSTGDPGSGSACINGGNANAACTPGIRAKSACAQGSNAKGI